jgi:hypothetical protein
MRLSQFDARDKIDVRLLPMALQAMPGVTGHYTKLLLTLRLFSLCAPCLCPLCVRFWARRGLVAPARMPVGALPYAPRLNAVITSEQFSAQPLGRREVRARDLLFCGLVGIPTWPQPCLNSRKINTSKIKDFNPPEMNTCEKRGVGYPVGFVILLGCNSFRSGGGTA